MRGKAVFVKSVKLRSGITPAYAGKSPVMDDAYIDM